MDSDVWPKIDIRHFEETSSDWFSPDYWDYETISPHSSLMNLALVREFNRFLTNSFYQGHGEELERKFIQIRQEFGGGGICDMTALGIFLRRYWERPWCDSNTIKAGEFYLSHAISKVQTDLGISEKQLILIIQRKKYFHIFSLGKTRKYATLHFQGNDKYLIPYLAKFKFIFGNKGIFQYLVRAARKHQSISTRK
jgi:hypothetical protein